MPARWLVLGVGAYLAFALVLFPADVAYRWLAPDTVRLSGVQGTVWSGRATLGSAGSEFARCPLAGTALVVSISATGRPHRGRPG